jgi:ribose transport system permease protein
MSEANPNDIAVRTSVTSRLFGRLSQLAPLTALVIVIALFAVLDYRRAGEDAVFFTVDNARAIAVQSVVVGTAALGMTLIVIAGGIDLSAGTALALCAVTLAWCLDRGYGIGAAMVAAVGIGGLTGLFNGLLVSRLRVVPFIITLGTMTVYLGLAKLIAQETTIRPPLTSIPDWLKRLVSSPPDADWLIYPVLPNFASGIWLFFALAALLAFVLKQTTFGRYVFAIGSNEATARLCGLNVANIKTAVYTLSGLFVGTAGVLQFARLKIGNPTSGRGLELSIIAAVVVGGGSLSGGRGSVLGTIAGAVLMVVISSGCTILELSDSIQDIVLGAIIIAAVTLDELRRRRSAS